jgi:hypothetical protein
MNSSKTDVNIFFSSRNLLQLEALLDEADAGGICLARKVVCALC